MLSLLYVLATLTPSHASDPCRFEPEYCSNGPALPQTLVKKLTFAQGISPKASIFSNQFVVAIQAGAVSSVNEINKKSSLNLGHCRLAFSGERTDSIQPKDVLYVTKYSSSKKEENECLEHSPVEKEVNCDPDLDDGGCSRGLGRHDEDRPIQVCVKQRAIVNTVISIQGVSSSGSRFEMSCYAPKAVRGSLPLNEPGFLRSTFSSVAEIQ